MSRTSDTSPVLSTSILGTTPSLPPLGEHLKDKEHRQTIAVGLCSMSRDFCGRFPRSQCQSRICRRIASSRSEWCVFSVFLF